MEDSAALASLCSRDTGYVCRLLSRSLTAFHQLEQKEDEQKKDNSEEGGGFSGACLPRRGPGCSTVVSVLLEAQTNPSVKRTLKHITVKEFLVHGGSLMLSSVCVRYRDAHVPKTDQKAHISISTTLRESHKMVGGKYVEHLGPWSLCRRSLNVTDAAMSRG